MGCTMPTKPQSHSQRQATARKRALDKDYNAHVRTNGSQARAQKIYSSIRWQKVRRVKLSRHPLCEDPYKRHLDTPIAARDVDHIVPLRQDFDRAYELDNLQSLCVGCHRYKTGQERRNEG